MKQLRYLSLFLFCIACDPTQKSINKEGIRQEIEQMLSDYHGDIAKDGLTSEFKYLDQSDEFFWVPPGYNSPLSYDSVRQILEKNALAMRAISFEWDTLRIIPLSDKIANYTGIVVGQMTDTAGVESNVRIIESGTIIKRQDGWKLLSGQSAVLPSETKNDSLE